MPTKKIAEINDADQRTRLGKPPCFHREHCPPSMASFEPGVYEHECPACHDKIVVTHHGLPR